jgi:anti-sigma regulatory factor (Ser/Thr protein kinase)
MNGRYRYSPSITSNRIDTLPHYSLRLNKSAFLDGENSCQNDNQDYDREKLEFNRYRKELYEATNKKMLLVNEIEIKDHCKGDLLFWRKLKDTKDIPLTRMKIEEILSTKALDSGVLMNLLLAMSELTTNVIKHAEKGNISVLETKEELVCIIRDKGPGFDYKDLQHKTLVPGYSTKDSLGLGLSIVLKLSDQLLLSNTALGSIIVAKFHKQSSDKLLKEDSLRLVR